MTFSDLVQKCDVSLTATTVLGFVFVCAIFGGYSFVLRTKDLTAQHSELQYLRDEKKHLLEQNRELAEQLSDLQARCGGTEHALSGTESVATELQAGSQRSFVYTVKKGDTIWDIAALYNVNVKDLMRWNKLGPRSQIFPGDELTIILQE